jgi:hypothetical protein
MPKLGKWRWYCGMHDDDDEMAECGTRDDAIRFGLRENRPGDSFWIVEARMRVADEKAMADGRADTAPFAESRNGKWIVAGPAAIINLEADHAR